MDTHISHALRIFVLVLFPFIFGFWIVPHTAYMDGVLLSSPNENKSISTQGVSYSFVHSSGYMVPQTVNAIFPLAEYLDFYPFVSHSYPLLCFEDNGSFFILPNGSETTPNLVWDVALNNATFQVTPGSPVCAISKQGQVNNYEWHASIGADLGNTSGNITFVPKTVTYPRLMMEYGLLQGIIMIPVAYLLVFYPAAGILRKIRDGLGAQ